MKYCPICKSEFYDEVKVCPDHHVKLVGSLKNIKHEDNVHWVLLYQFINKTYFEMVSQVLEKNNIPYFQKNDFFEGAYLVKSGSPIGTSIKLYIPVKYLQKAKDLTGGMIDLDEE